MVNNTFLPGRKARRRTAQPL